MKNSSPTPSPPTQPSLCPVYHQFAHASHYRDTSFQLWVDNINFITHNGAYGDADDPGVEKTDLSEMWGYFLGREYAHRRYGPNAHSAILEFYSAIDASPSTFNNSWYAVNEHRSWIGAPIFEWEHIPAGFLHDLIDDNNYNQDSTHFLNESTIVADTISGYKLSTIFNNLDGSTTSPATLMNKLRNNLPAGNTAIHFDLLRNSFGY